MSVDEAVKIAVRPIPAHDEFITLGQVLKWPA